MPYPGDSLDRIGRFGGHRWFWLALGALALLAIALFVDDILLRPPAGKGDPRDPGGATATPFLVESPSGARIGALTVEYPRSLRENQDASVKVRYSPAASAKWRAEWEAHAAGPNAPKLSVELAAARLALEPQPASYIFDNARISAGGDGRSWIVSPQKEGDYTLLVRLNVEPASFKPVPVSVNGEALGGAREVPLPVTVYTRYRVSQSIVDLAKLAASALSFLLTLPLAAAIFRRMARRRARTAPAGTPVGPAPAPGLGGEKRNRRG